MTLKLKTNRNDIIVWWLPIFCLIAVCEVIFLVMMIVYHEKAAGSESLAIAIGVLLGIYLLIILLYKFCDRKQHIFTNIAIEVLSNKEQIYYITIEEIASIKYVPFNARYIWRRISGADMFDDKACKMYVTMKQGNCYIIGCFSRRDVKKIKKLYGDLVQII